MCWKGRIEEIGKKKSRVGSNRGNRGKKVGVAVKRGLGVRQKLETSGVKEQGQGEDLLRDPHKNLS